MEGLGPKGAIQGPSPGKCPRGHEVSCAHGALRFLLRFRRPVLYLTNMVRDPRPLYRRHRPPSRMAITAIRDDSENAYGIGVAGYIALLKKPAGKVFRRQLGP